MTKAFTICMYIYNIQWKWKKKRNNNLTKSLTPHSLIFGKLQMFKLVYFWYKWFLMYKLTMQSMLIKLKVLLTLLAFTSLSWCLQDFFRHFTTLVDGFAFTFHRTVLTSAVVCPFGLPILWKSFIRLYLMYLSIFMNVQWLLWTISPISPNDFP